MPAPSGPEPTFLFRAHCPALECRHLAHARSLEAVIAAVEAHVARCHGTLVTTT